MKKLFMTFLFAAGVGASISAPASTCHFACSIDRKNCLIEAGSDPAAQKDCYMECTACMEACG